MSQLQLVVFDLAGTTVRDDDLVGRALLRTAEEHGLETSLAELNAMMGRSKLEVFRELAQRRSPQEAESLAARALADFQRHMIAAYEQACEPLPGAEEAFRFLRRHGVRVATNTGFDRPVTDAILRRLGWLGVLIEAAVCVDDVPAGRPAPYMIFRAMMDLGVTDVRRVAKVGDNPSDLQEGTNAGCGAVIGVLSGVGDVEALGRWPHTHLLPSVVALPALAEAEGWVSR